MKLIGRANTAARSPYVAQARLSTPLGTVTLAATARGLAGLWFDGQRHHPGALDAPRDEQQVHIAAARRELAAYWRDPSHRFALALDPQGTPFQRQVWAAMARIRSGQTGGYGRIAAQLGRAGAARAVGAAVGRNPICIILPCHRVLGKDGSLTGYAGGLHRKEKLLRREGVLAAAALAR
jgi:methylated-DNA-[protein]-cysteine S-methyltransferase